MLRIRRCTLEDADALSRLMTASANRFIVHEFSDAGREHLLVDMLPEAVAARIGGGAPHFAAEIDGELVGMIAMTGESHLYHLFVDERHHRQGIASALWVCARDATLAESPIEAFTVNSSRYAVSFYEALGFVVESAPVTREGVTCIPMRLRIESNEGLAERSTGKPAGRS